jgi:acyl-CoA thioester hydrolase
MARGEFFRSIGFPLTAWQAQNIILPVVECHVRYKAAARYDEVLSIDLWVAEVRRARLGFEYLVFRESRGTVLEASTMHVCTTVDEKPRRLPEELLEAFKPYTKRADL